METNIFSKKNENHIADSKAHDYGNIEYPDIIENKDSDRMQAYLKKVRKNIE